ncbi:hypothetical protein GC089_02780 [Cellulomonas sp. JZ18]|uniref:sugar-binding protein n=1 Tax=Cellulomonas sp. JZ18 TaxID=2654191 RepID=UPI0012D3CEDC|nr:sugar-binding protein [Cellulomonas sp. JZ18]QGQ18375.1 hypothetical protein GC089_02780 [Cellulomonas sp. JZ18]
MRRTLPRVVAVLTAATLAGALLPGAASAEPGDPDDPLVVGYGSPNIGAAAVDPLWADVAAVPLTRSSGSPAATAQVRSLWDEDYLYTLVEVTDPVLDASSGQLYAQDSVEVFLDLADDKSAGHTTYVPLQDFQFRISHDNRPSFDHGGDDRLISHTRVQDGGYVVESVFAVGDLDVDLAAGTRLGFDVQVNDAAGGTRVGQLFWHDGTGSQWQRPNVFGSVVLGERPDVVPDRVDKVPLFYAVTQAGRVVPAVYDNPQVLDAPLAAARAVLADEAATQDAVDAADADLRAALHALERTGPYPDPKRYEPQAAMPDLFRFLDGSRVGTAEDWAERRDEIAGMAQYYQYGYQAPAPDSLTARLGERSGFDWGCWCSVTSPAVVVEMAQEVDGEVLTRSFAATLQMPDPDSGWAPPYPVVVGFGNVPGAEAFHANGIATIAYTPTDVANENRTGVYYDFSPWQKDVVGADTGTIMGWAWGVSRVVDALAYVDPATASARSPTSTPRPSPSPGTRATARAPSSRGRSTSGSPSSRRTAPGRPGRRAGATSTPARTTGSRTAAPRTRGRPTRRRR